MKEAASRDSLKNQHIYLTKSVKLSLYTKDFIGQFIEGSVADKSTIPRFSVESKSVNNLDSDYLFRQVLEIH